MYNGEIRREIDHYLQMREETTNKLREYTYQLYEKETGVRNPDIGWKRMLRELGFVI